jgi:hypothetical protein
MLKTIKPMSTMAAHTASATNRIDDFAGRFHAGFAILSFSAIAAPEIQLAARSL